MLVLLGVSTTVQKISIIVFYPFQGGAYLLCEKRLVSTILAHRRIGEFAQMYYVLLRETQSVASFSLDASSNVKVTLSELDKIEKSGTLFDFLYKH
jgi:hypothetical protein